MSTELPRTSQRNRMDAVTNPSRASAAFERNLMPEYAHLFTPLTVRGRTIPNRIVSTPHATAGSCRAG